MSNETSEEGGAWASAFEAQYFVHDGAGVIGPVLGSKLKELIENGAVARHASINRVGAPDWTPVLDAQPFARFFPVIQPSRSAEAERSQYASFWIRLAAYAIDEAFCFLAVFLVANILVGAGAALYGLEETKSFLTEHDFVRNGVGLSILMIYHGYFMSGAWQATPGKRICGIYVIRTNGARIDAAFAVLRYLSYFLSFLPLGAGFAMILFTDERKALHDMIMGTRVVRGRL